MSIIKKYDKILIKMYDKLMDSGQKITQKDIQEIYQKIGQLQVKQANNSIKITMDNQLGEAIFRMIKENQKKYNDDFKRLQSYIIYLSLLTNHLSHIKFITTRQKHKIDQLIKLIKSDKNYKFNQRILALQKSDSTQDFRQQFFNIIYGKDGNIDYEDDDKVKKLYEEFYKVSMKDANMNRKLFIKIDSILSCFQDKNKLFSEQFLEDIESYFGKQMGKNDFQININKCLIQTAEEETLESNQQHLEMLNEQYEEIKKILNKFSSGKIFTDLKIQLYVSRFGSIISGFATKNTDMDITILTNCYINQIQFLQYLQSYIKAQFKQKKYNGYSTNFVKNARIPVLKLKIPSKNDSIVYVDLIVNNILGVINSKFLSVYAKVPWIKHLGILIKLWAKKIGLIDEQLFSSYSFNLMLIHFLFETDRINLIMDARQRHPDKTPYFDYKRKMKEQEQKFRVYFQYKTKIQDVTSLKRVNIYQVLYEFFVYFSQNGKHWKYSKQQSIITVDGSKEKIFQDNYLFVIRDPFDEKHNPGRVLVTQRGRVMRDLHNTVKILKQKNIEDIMRLF